MNCYTEAQTNSTHSEHSDRGILAALTAGGQATAMDLAAPLPIGV